MSPWSCCGSVTWGWQLVSADWTKICNGVFPKCTSVSIHGQKCQILDYIGGWLYIYMYIYINIYVFIYLYILSTLSLLLGLAFMPLVYECLISPADYMLIWIMFLLRTDLKHLCGFHVTVISHCCQYYSIYLTLHTEEGLCLKCSCQDYKLYQMWANLFSYWLIKIPSTGLCSLAEPLYAFIIDFLFKKQRYDE